MSSSSPSSIPCSVLMLTRNNAVSLQACLQALQDFSEIIVVDGHSTDGTRAIASQFMNVRLIDQPREYLDAEGRILDFSAVRNAGLAVMTQSWVLMVDTGELLPEAFIAEVRQKVQSTPGVYYAHRIFFVDGVRIDRCSGYPARQIRLFHRSCTTGYVKAVHERLHLRPGTDVRTLVTPLPEIAPPRDVLRDKYAHYRELEYRRLGVLPWSRWVRHVLWRNLRSCAGLSLRLLGIWLFPGPGKRMPLVYECAYMRQLVYLTVGLFPPIARRRMRLNGIR